MSALNLPGYDTTERLIALQPQRPRLDVTTAKNPVAAWRENSAEATKRLLQKVN